jgi:hypothetical protein
VVHRLVQGARHPRYRVVHVRSADQEELAKRHDEFTDAVRLILVHLRRSAPPGIGAHALRRISEHTALQLQTHRQTRSRGGVQVDHCRRLLQ